MKATVLADNLLCPYCDRDLRQTQDVEPTEEHVIAGDL